MTDRELLEAAARAAGHKTRPDWYSPSPKLGVCLVNERGNQSIGWFNPLTDDGDALRLAAKLYLWEAIRLAHRLVSVDVDIYAATRRAIVRAAAAMAPK